jgi:uncharacterized protein (TIGR01244 family)
MLIAVVTGLSLVISCAPSENAGPQRAGIEMPDTVPGRKDLYQAGRFYFGGQPDEELLHWMAKDGVEVVINLRTDKEMDTHTKEKFDEVALVGELGMTYLQLPMGGTTGYTPATVDTFAQVLGEHDGKILIHCRSAGRVSYLWVAYLIRHRGFSVDEAIAIGKKIKFRFYLEDLLGYPLTMRRRYEAR